MFLFIQLETQNFNTSNPLLESKNDMCRHMAKFYILRFMIQLSCDNASFLYRVCSLI